MYFKDIPSTKFSVQDNKRPKILAQLLLSAFTIMACVGVFHHFQSESRSGLAYAATVDAHQEPSLAAYHASHLRKSRSGIRALAKRIYKKPEMIRGQAVSHLVQIFYHPELIRREGAVVLWQYRNEECVLDIYFQAQDSSAGTEKISYFETRTRDPQSSGASNTEACVQSLLKTSNAPRMVDVSSIYKL